MTDVGVIPPPPMFSCQPDDDDVAADGASPQVSDNEPISGESLHFTVCSQVLTEALLLYSDTSDEGAAPFESMDDQLDVSSRLIQTVPAKEPHLDAIPLKSALKKAAGEAKASAKCQETAIALLR